MPTSAKHADYFRELRSIVAQSEPAERVVLAHLSLLPLAGAPVPVPAAAQIPAARRSSRNSRPKKKPDEA
ncbi:MAG: hypothetical protein ABI895_28375 [Deltaproteobacteria bacterium]